MLGSTRGLSHLPFTEKSRVRIPYRVPSQVELNGRVKVPLPRKFNGHFGKTNKLYDNGFPRPPDVDNPGRNWNSSPPEKDSAEVLVKLRIST